MVADGHLDAEYVRVESEHSAASACLGERRGASLHGKLIPGHHADG